MLVVVVTVVFIKAPVLNSMNKLLYGFIWKKNDKIKRTALINHVENGALKILDIESVILSHTVRHCDVETIY